MARRARRAPAHSVHPALESLTGSDPSAKYAAKAEEIYRRGASKTK
jgi:hypothetical protein